MDNQNFKTSEWRRFKKKYRANSFKKKSEKPDWTPEVLFEWNESRVCWNFCVKRGMVMVRSGEQISHMGGKKEEMQAELLIANWWGVKVEVSFHFFFCSEDSSLYYQDTHEQQYKLLIFKGLYNTHV